MFRISDLPKNISTEKKNKTSGTDKTYSFLMISEGEVVSQFEVSNSKPLLEDSKYPISASKLLTI